MSGGILLAIHIVAGIIGLVAGLGALVSTKGSAMHVRAGRVFWHAMLMVGASAFALAIIGANAFLLLVAVFSSYLVISGRRALQPDAPARLDRVLAVAMAACGAVMLTLAVLGAFAIRPLPIRPTLMPVLAVFGAIATALAVLDRRAFAREMDRERRLVRHVTRIVPGLIAALTAVAVVNLSQLPDLLRWLGPTVLLIPVIAFFVRRVRRGEI